MSGYTLIYSANGGSGAPPTRKCSGAVTLSDAAPTRPGYIFLGWSENINATKPQYAPGTPLTIAASKTLFAVWKVDPNAPVAAIRGYVPERTERFFTTVEFAADVKNVPADAQAVWFVNGEPKQIGTDTFACVGAKQDYTVQVKLMQDKNPTPIAESAVETVQIKRSFTDILSSLFRLIFNRPYYVKQ